MTVPLGNDQRASGVELRFLHDSLEARQSCESHDRRSVGPLRCNHVIREGSGVRLVVDDRGKESRLAQPGRELP